MVQSITGISSDSAVSSINGTGKLDRLEIQAAFEAALSQASAPKEVSAESSNEDLIQEFKNVTKGITVCKTCGAIYHGTAVAECSKCGNNVNDDKKKTSEAKGTEPVAGAEVAGGAEASTPIANSVSLSDVALVKTT